MCSEMLLFEHKIIKGSEKEAIESESEEDDDVFLDNAIKRANVEYNILRTTLQSEENLWAEVNKDIKGESLRQKILKQIKGLKTFRKRGFAKIYVSFVAQLSSQIALADRIGRLVGGGPEEEVENAEIVQKGFVDEDSEEKVKEKVKEAVKEELVEEPPLKKIKVEKQCTLSSFFKGSSHYQTVQLPEKRRPGRPPKKILDVQVDVSAIQCPSPQMPVQIKTELPLLDVQPSIQQSSALVALSPDTSNPLKDQPSAEPNQFQMVSFVSGRPLVSVDLKRGTAGIHHKSNRRLPGAAPLKKEYSVVQKV
jgi:hypothetical protein